MARPATGSVVEYEGVRGRTFSIRSRVNGERVFETLGVAPEWDRKRAEQALADRLAAVRLGIWKPLRPDADQAVPTSRTLHVFASEWFDRRRQEVGERTTEHWKWALSNHVLPVLGDHEIGGIGPEQVGSPTPTPGVLSVVEVYTITGGTGRFADATGTFTLEIIVTQATGVSTGTFSGVIDH